ncbi:alpha/beta fold hydrolase [Deinococcus altitudinis]|uniref:alpha/beta fold hydrolase n=1 Tax=Deinococcus altitudinis TaxID=468914 RepID=UPI003891288F
MSFPTAPEVHHVPGTHLEVNGHRLWVEQEGRGEPVLLLHGGPANSHLTFHPYFSSLADDFRVIYLDYYGRGLSEQTTDLRDVTFQGDVRDVAALIETLGLGPVNLYGFSYGGMIAQALALDHPHLMKRLVLANTLHSPEMWQRNHENINREIERQFPEVWEEIVRLRSQGMRSTEPRVQALYQVHGPLMRFYNPDNAARLLSDPWSRNADLYPVFVGDDVDFFIGGEVAKLPDFRPRLRELLVPALVLAGRYDRALYPQYQRDFQQFAPQVEFVMLERSGSFGHIEEPETVMTLLKEFYTR